MVELDQGLLCCVFWQGFWSPAVAQTVVSVGEGQGALCRQCWEVLSASLVKGKAADAEPALTCGLSHRSIQP